MKHETPKFNYLVYSKENPLGERPITIKEDGFCCWILVKILCKILLPIYFKIYCWEKEHGYE